MSEHEPKPGDWVRNYADTVSVLWTGHGKRTWAVYSDGRVIPFRPRLDIGHKPATGTQARRAEAVLRESEHCPDPWPGQVDELPEGGLDGYWRDRDGDIWSYRNGEWLCWYNITWAGASSYVPRGWGPFTPTALPEDAEPQETPEAKPEGPTREELQARVKELEESLESSERSSRELLDAFIELRYLREETQREVEKLHTQLDEAQEINAQRSESLRQAHADLDRALNQRDRLRSMLATLTTEEILDALLAEG